MTVWKTKIAVQSTAAFQALVNAMEPPVNSVAVISTWLLDNEDKTYRAGATLRLRKTETKFPLIEEKHTVELRPVQPNGMPFPEIREREESIPASAFPALVGAQYVAPPCISSLISQVCYHVPKLFIVGSYTTMRRTYLWDGCLVELDEVTRYNNQHYYIQLDAGPAGHAVFPRIASLLHELGVQYITNVMSKAHAARVEAFSVAPAMDQHTPIAAPASLPPPPELASQGNSPSPSSALDGSDPFGFSTSFAYAGDQYGVLEASLASTSLADESVSFHGTPDADADASPFMLQLAPPIAGDMEDLGRFFAPSSSASAVAKSAVSGGSKRLQGARSGRVTPRAAVAAAAAAASHPASPPGMLAAVEAVKLEGAFAGAPYGFNGEFEVDPSSLQKKRNCEASARYRRKKVNEFENLKAKFNDMKAELRKMQSLVQSLEHDKLVLQARLDEREGTLRTLIGDALPASTVAAAVAPKVSSPARSFGSPQSD